jgi:hypothetical protein
LIALLTGQELATECGETKEGGVRSITILQGEMQGYYKECPTWIMDNI